MRVAIVLEQRFSQTPDGKVWTSGPGRYSFWQRYLAIFSEVKVVARVASVSEPPDGGALASGPDVSFVPVPCYIGVAAYLRHFYATRTAIRDSIDNDEAVILRVPSNLGGVLSTKLQAVGRPFCRRGRG